MKEEASDIAWVNTSDPSSVASKLAQLRERFRSMESVLIAFSAGVDSTFVAAVAAQELGTKAVAVTATSPSFPERELAEAKALAESLGLQHRIIESNELANPNYANNPKSRCYHCKTELYGLLREMADREGFKHIVDGTNADDLRDYRPGRKAAMEKNVESPLMELAFSKDDIRAASRMLKLPTSDKPAFSCLASRFPYGVEITVDGLKRVEQAENGLREMGFTNLRVRSHDDIARIEVPPGDIARLTSDPVRDVVVTLLKRCGFRYVTIDLQGYRRGSLNEVFQAPS